MLRFFAFTACYFAQGIPIGLVSVAVPARLAELDVSAGEISLVLGVVSFPWAINSSGAVHGSFQVPVNGFSPALGTGWHRAVCRCHSVAMSFVSINADASLIPLMVAGFVVNAFAATQDVAVDGMAIDVLQQDERGRANAFMGFGQAAGSASFGALCGFLLSMAGMLLLRWFAQRPWLSYSCLWRSYANALVND